MTLDRQLHRTLRAIQYALDTIDDDSPEVSAEEKIEFCENAVEWLTEASSLIVTHLARMREENIQPGPDSSIHSETPNS